MIKAVIGIIKNIRKIDETPSQFFCLKMNTVDRPLESLRKVTRLPKSAVSGLKQ